MLEQIGVVELEDSLYFLYKGTEFLENDYYTFVKYNEFDYGNPFQNPEDFEKLPHYENLYKMLMGVGGGLALYEGCLTLYPIKN